MTAATMIKRIGTERKEIARYEKEIRKYQKEIADEQLAEVWKNDCRKWIAYYEKLIAKHEIKIAEMSKQAAQLATAEEKKEMVKAMAADMMKNGVKTIGITTSGLNYRIYGNHGITERSRYCYSMDVEGRGTVFTSGTIETVAEYILNN